MYKTIDKIPADLKWLAENVNEVPGEYDSKIRLDSDGEVCFSDDIARDFYPDFKPSFGTGKEYTRSEHQAARDLISGKPGWDEAPEGYKWRWQNEDGAWKFGKGPKPEIDSQPGEGHYYVTDFHTLDFPGRVLGDWRDTLERRPTDHTNELLDGGAPEEREEREEPLADLYPKYYKDVTGLHSIDVYMTHKLFGIDDPSGCIQHASKKLLLSGVRTGGKSKVDDIREARNTLTRWLEINE